MARPKNVLSKIQQDETLFGGICEAIDMIGPDALVGTGKIGRTSVFKYKRREPVNPRVEVGLLKAIEHSGDPKYVNTLAAAGRILKSIKKAR
ncbi:hypothetical protein [Fibrella forsythiae]|uniref:Uncharacterized protein n=1 Tax=Fibrella forsythiae TaxID=2817061 RepID=A0ABS3JC42_9BACT|nr:hypothetical protein [Fibrella forsythiae]MBO0947562.1 hypothetical protein [Fibrella forsythiae]